MRYCRYHEQSGSSYDEAEGEILRGEILGWAGTGSGIIVVIDDGGEKPVTRYMNEIRLEKTDETPSTEKSE